MGKRTRKPFPGCRGEFRTRVVIGYMEGGKSDVALGYDPLQWFLGRLSVATGEWTAVFYPTSKDTLYRHLREMGATITPEGQAFIDRLDDFFPGSAGDNRRKRGGEK